MFERKEYNNNSYSPAVFHPYSVRFSFLSFYTVVKKRHGEKEYFETVMQDYNQNRKGRNLRKYCSDEGIDYK